MRITVLIVSFCLVAAVAFKLGATGSAATSTPTKAVAQPISQQPKEVAPAEQAKADGGLPQCDSKDAKDGIKDTIENNAYSGSVKLQVIDMDKLAEVSYSEQERVRECIGKVSLNTGDENIAYKFSYAKSNPSQVIINLRPIDFKLPDVSSDKDIDAGVKDAFQGTWKYSSQAGDATITFNGKYASMTGAGMRVCRVLNYGRDNTSSRVAFLSFCRVPSQEPIADFDACKSHEVPSLTSRGGMTFHTYSESFICHATDLSRATLVSNGSLQLSDADGPIAVFYKQQ